VGPTDDAVAKGKISALASIVSVPALGSNKKARIIIIIIIVLLVGFKASWGVFLGDDQTDDPSDMVGMELGILAPVKTNPSYICLEELRKTNPIFTVTNLQLQCALTNINYKNIILLKNGCCCSMRAL
jgi:hypothetical protein